MRSISFRLLWGTFAVSRLDPLEPVPMWAYSGDFFSITRSNDELSIVCGEPVVPREVKHEGDWRALQAVGPFGFDEIGVAASFTAPLADAGVPIFVISTFDTDYLLVKNGVLERCIATLEAAGHQVER